MCGGQAMQYYVLPHTQIWRCQVAACELQFACPQLSEERLSKAYAELYYSPDGKAGCFDPTAEEILRQFLHSAREQHFELVGKRILDYGCGPGSLAKMARKYDMIPTGVEADPNAREQVSFARICPVYADLDQLMHADPDARFDWVVLWNVIEHLRQPWLEIAKIREICAPGAHLVVVTPNANCLRSQLMRARWDQRLNRTHFYYFTQTSLIATLRAAGFGDVANHNQYTAYLHHGPLRRLIQRMLAATRLDGKLEFWAMPDESRAALSAAPSPLAKVG
jgi:2-polyprenyl-3-methyl-5-hydroxy-6-metoxy-1,4-benzoquinol methylase